MYASVQGNSTQHPSNPSRGYLDSSRHSKPILTSSPTPQLPPSFPAPWISSPNLVPSASASSSSLTASLARLGLPVAPAAVPADAEDPPVPRDESVTRRRSEGGLKRADREDEDSSDAES